jgi:hypothetical protein
MWLSGSKFLRESEELLPEMLYQPDIKDENNEVKQKPYCCVNAVVLQENIFDKILMRCSSWFRQKN